MSFSFFVCILEKGTWSKLYNSIWIIDRSMIWIYLGVNTWVGGWSKIGHTHLIQVGYYFLQPGCRVHYVYVGSYRLTCCMSRNIWLGTNACVERIWPSNCVELATLHTGVSCRYIVVGILCRTGVSCWYVVVGILCHNGISCWYTVVWYFVSHWHQLLIYSGLVFCVTLVSPADI